MTWFARDHTGRELSERERGFVGALATLLAEVRPAQLLESETALTAEGADCLILLMPHRALGGVSLVVWLFRDRADVTWAQIASLACYHDDLDGVWVGRFGLHPSHPDFGPALNCIREQFAAPVTLQFHGPRRATVLIHDENGILRTVGYLGRPPGFFEWLWRHTPTTESVVRFTDRNPPLLTESSGVEKWFTAGHWGT